MTTLHSLNNYLEELLQASSIPDYCQNGIQVEGAPKIKKIASAVTANLKTIESAVNCKANALIVHHGIFWNRDEHRIKGSKRSKLWLLLKNNISLLAYHLPLDLHRELGNNWKAAVDLGWKNLEPFGSLNNLIIGVKGTFNEIPINEFQKKLEEYYQHPAHVAFGGKKRVQSAALISGGSYKSVNEAATEGLDCFISGNFDESAWDTAYEESINFLSLGHYATEKIGVQTLGKQLSKKFNIKHDFLDIVNPF